MMDEYMILMTCFMEIAMLPGDSYFKIFMSRQEW